MKINHAHAHAVVDRIDAFHREPTDGDPRGFDMSLWFAEHGVGFGVPESQAGAIECRTSACLAGWTVTLLDSAEAARDLMTTETTVYGGIGEMFMSSACELLEADDMASDALRALFCKLSYTWSDARDELLDIMSASDDTSRT